MESDAAAPRGGAMTALDAAQQVLREAGMPLSHDEITRRKLHGKPW
jgi:hypothetical protein